MADTNAQLAGRFEQMAQLAQILGANRFKVIAYEKAARTLGALTQDITSLPREQWPNLEGIGKGTAQRIDQFLDLGHIPEHTQLLDQVPPGVVAMLNLSGLGPKTAALLWKEGGIETLDQLQTQLEQAQLNHLKGFGPKKAQAILKSLAFHQASRGRVRLGAAMPLARAIMNAMQTLPQVQQMDYAGSLRRGQETIGDIDLLISADPQHAPAISQAFTQLDIVADVIVQGKTKTSIRTHDPLQVDLRIVSPEHYASALCYFTGSKQHNVALRKLAKTRGLTLNEYQLTDAQTGQALPSPAEHDLYAHLGLPWIAPELRQDQGEIALAQQGQLPTLIERADIGAELHAHTTASDGQLTLRQLAQVAIARGYHTLAITDHSVSQAQANGLSPQRLEQHIADIRQLAHELKGQLNLLAGSEVDILANGSLDYPDSLLAQLDLVVASPHAALSQDDAQATTRLLKAIDNPYVTILGHPTGRLILQRQGLRPDMHALCHGAAQRGIALEINAHSARLDLCDRHAKIALEAGAKLAINTDAHSQANFDQLQYGLSTARRAGATAHDVVNCLSPTDLMAWIASTRSA